MIRILLLILLCLIPGIGHSNQPWGLCPGTPVTGMIPCDTACFGQAGLDLGIEFVAQELQLDNAFVDNTSKWVDFNNTYVDYATQYANDKGSNHQQFVRALDGVAKKVSLSFEMAAGISARNVDNVINNYIQMRKDSQKVKYIYTNIFDLNSPYTSFKGDWLLSNLEQYQQQKNSQIELESPLVMASEPNYDMTTTEKALALTKPTIDDPIVSSVGRLLSQDLLSEPEAKSLSRSLSVLFVDNNIDRSSAMSRVKQVKRKLALSLLIDSLYLNKKGSELSGYQFDAIKMALAEDLSGANKRALPHALNEEIIYTQALANTLLSGYLKQKRQKNALAAVGNL